MSIKTDLMEAEMFRDLLQVAERQADSDNAERAELIRLQIEIEAAKRRLAKKTEHKLDVLC